MTLSCDYEFEPEPGTTVWWPPTKFTDYPAKRSTKCCSCGEQRIKTGDRCLEFERYKVPEYDVEIRIYGEDGDCGPPRASHFMCFECGWRFMALQSAGYALNIYDSMNRLMIEHDDMVARGLGGCR